MHTSQTAVDRVGNRYDLVIIASNRVRTLKQENNTKLSKSGPVETALKEIETGVVGREYLYKFEKSKK